jgi:hypothetical protein
MKIQAWYGKCLGTMNDVVTYQIVVTGKMFRENKNSLAYRTVIAKEFSDCIKSDIKERIYRNENHRPSKKEKN